MRIIKKILTISFDVTFLLNLRALVMFSFVSTEKTRADSFIHKFFSFENRKRKSYGYKQREHVNYYSLEQY